MATNKNNILQGLDYYVRSLVVTPIENLLCNYKCVFKIEIDRLSEKSFL